MSSVLQLALLLLLVALSSHSRAVELSDESECLSLLKAGALKHEELFGLAVRSAWWSCSTEAAMATGTDQVSALLDLFNMEQRALTTKLTQLKSVIEGRKPMPVISPALQWAQSTDFVYLNVKFAHIWSAPATLNVEVKQVTISGSSLLFEASDGKKQFRLELELEADLDKDNCTWSMASVGRITFNLKKADAPSRWSKVLVNKGRGQVSRWSDMQERWDRELNMLKPTGDDEKSGSADKKTKSSSDKKKDSDGDGDGDEDGAEKGGSITTPEAQQREDRKKAKMAELTARLAEIEADGKQRKRDVDFEAANRRKEIEQETADRKARARAEHEKSEL